MNSIVIYDSTYGNTAAIATAVAAGLAEAAPCRLVRAGGIPAADLAAADLVVIGSPTHGFNPVPSVAQLLHGLSAAAIAGRAFAVFDTRIDLADIPSRPLRWAAKVGGYAAPHMATWLRSHGARLLAEPEGFLVAGREGPFKEGELVRARAWGRALAEAATQTPVAA